MFGMSDQEFAALLALIVMFALVATWVMIRIGFAMLAHKLNLLLERTKLLDHHIRYPNTPPPDTDVE